MGEPEEWPAKPQVMEEETRSLRPARPSVDGFSRSARPESARSISFSDDTGLGNILSTALGSTAAPSEVDTRPTALSKNVATTAAELQAKVFFGPSLTSLAGRSRPQSARSCASSSSASALKRSAFTSTGQRSASTLTGQPLQNTRLKATWTAVLEKCGVWRRGSAEGHNTSNFRVDSSPVPPDALRTAWCCAEFAKALNQLPFGILRSTLMLLVEELFHSIYQEYKFVHEPFETSFDEKSKPMLREDFNELVPYFAVVGSCYAHARDAGARAREAVSKQAGEAAKRKDAERANADLEANLKKQKEMEKDFGARMQGLKARIHDLETTNDSLKYEAEFTRKQMFEQLEKQMDLEDALHAEQVARETAEKKNAGLIRETEILRAENAKPEQRKPEDAAEKVEMQRTIANLQRDITTAFNERDIARAETRKSLSRSLEWPESGPHVRQWMSTPDAPPRIENSKDSKETPRRKSSVKSRKSSIAGNRKSIRRGSKSRSSSPRLSDLAK